MFEKNNKASLICASYEARVSVWSPRIKFYWQVLVGYVYLGYSACFGLYASSCMWKTKKSTTYKTMDKVQNKPNSSVQHKPSSESFQVYLCVPVIKFNRNQFINFRDDICWQRDTMFQLYFNFMQVTHKDAWSSLLEARLVTFVLYCYPLWFI
jgi:hypothetical protein